MKFIKLFVVLILIPPFILGILVFLKEKGEKEKQVILEEKGLTYANVIYSGDMKGCYIDVEYWVAEIKYYASEPSPCGIQENESYGIVYDKKNPHKFFFEFYNAKFDSKVVEASTIGILKSIHFKSGYFDRHSSILFKYEINGTEYERVNIIDSATLSLLKVGDIYKVKYNVDNYKSAFLDIYHLTRPRLAPLSQVCAANL